MLLNAAFDKVKQLELFFGDDIPWNAIEQGFVLEGEKVFLANRARGIFKPKQLVRGLVSIKTTLPRSGRVNIYSDKEQDEGFFRYSLQKGDPYSGGNKHLWEALEDKSPFVYFHAVAEGIYKAIWPCFVTAIHPELSYCEVVTSVQDQRHQDERFEYEMLSDSEKRYAVRETKVRLHQAAFRESVLAAYDHRCAISRLPVVRLLEAAHIIPDSDTNSTASINNGISLSRIHHKAYDANLLGISADFQIIVGDQLLKSKTGVLLDAIVDCHKRNLILPKNISLRPDRDLLESRFKQFKECNC